MTTNKNCIPIIIVIIVLLIVFSAIIINNNKNSNNNPVEFYTEHLDAVQNNRPPMSPTQATCPRGTEYYAGLCYRDCPANYTRLAACTCKGGSVVTDCNKYGVTATPKITCPEGTSYWGGLCYTDACENKGGKRIASCSCQFAPCKVDTNCAEYGYAVVPKRSCPEGTESYAGLCYKSCPSGMKKTAVCSCSDLDIQTNCAKYGAAGIPMAK